MPAHQRVYMVLPDFEVAGQRGSDALDWIETDDEAINMEQAERHEMIAGTEPSASTWTPYPAVYVKSDHSPITASFFKFGSFLAASDETRRQLSALPDFEWLPLDPVADTPSNLALFGTPSFYVMRFCRQVAPHPKSRFTYYPGTRSIDEVCSLRLDETTSQDLYVFRLVGDPVTHYATERFVDLCKREGLKGLEFTPMPCD